MLLPLLTSYYSLYTFRLTRCHFPGSCRRFDFPPYLSHLPNSPGCCLEIEAILGRLEDNPQKEENEKCAFHLLKEVDEFIVMSYGLLGNKHIMLST